MYPCSDAEMPRNLMLRVRFPTSARMSPLALFVPEWALVSAAMVRAVPDASAESDFFSHSEAVRVVEASAISSPFFQPVDVVVVRLVAAADASAASLEETVMELPWMLQV